MSKYTVIRLEGLDLLRRRYSLLELEAFISECRSAGLDLSKQWLEFSRGPEAWIQQDA